MANGFSVETIDSPEFIDIHPYNPFISECQIKVLYLGMNRNASYIDKDAAIKIANSLPMSPIVGAYSADKGDFKGHEQRIVVEDGELKFMSDTRPYGFVAPDARAWFQKFDEFDEEGNPVEREYLMTTGYLWTGQYEEARKIVERGKGQSMELDSATTKGEWAKDNNSGMEFFIINDALITKLCVLGDDVEPCFEGASIFVTDKPSEFSKQELDFRHALFTMVRELNDALGEKEGGSNMPNEQEELENVDAAEETVEQKVEVEPEQPEVAAEEVAEEEPEPEPEIAESAAEDVSEFSKKKDEAPSDEGAKDKQDDNSGDANADGPADDAPQDDKSGDSQDDKSGDSQDDKSGDSQDDKSGDSQEQKKDDKKKPSPNHSLLDEEAVLAELAELREFKHRVESAEKDKVINKYHMLSDEDKSEVVAHKDEYSLEQIDEKLALVYVNKNVDFSTVDGAPAQKPAEKKSLLAFSLDDVDFGDAEPIDEVQEALRSL